MEDTAIQGFKRKRLDLGETHVERLKLKDIEVKMEQLQRELTAAISRGGKALSDPSIIAVSRKLDSLITTYMREKAKK